MIEPVVRVRTPEYRTGCQYSARVFAKFCQRISFPNNKRELSYHPSVLTDRMGLDLCLALSLGSIFGSKEGFMDGNFVGLAAVVMIFGIPMALMYTVYRIREAADR